MSLWTWLFGRKPDPDATTPYDRLPPEEQRIVDEAEKDALVRPEDAPPREQWMDWVEGLPGGFDGDVQQAQSMQPPK